LAGIDIELMDSLFTHLILKKEVTNLKSSMKKMAFAPADYIEIQNISKADEN
jgi:hypothetical protein